MAEHADLETVRAEADGRVGRLTLIRPDALNALTRQVLADLAAAARWFDARSEVRVVVVAGEGPTFCAGYDLRDLAAALDEGPAILEDPTTSPAHLGAAMAEAIDRMRAVTVARLHGAVVGGGLVLAAACDLRVAADDVTFLIPEVQLGIPLGWGGLHRLVAEIGPARTKELVITCRPFGADEAAAMLTRTVPRDDLDDAVEDLVATVLARPAGPVETTCRQVDALRDGLPAEAATAAATQALLDAVADPAFPDIVSAALDRLGIER